MTMQANVINSTQRTAASRELSPKDVIADLLEELLLDDPQGVAEMIVERLRDAGFVIKPAKAPRSP